MSNVGDIIYREEAIEAQEAYMADHSLDGYEDGLAMIDILRDLPPAQPERMKGQWCVKPDGGLVCSRCYENPTNRIIVNGNLIYDMTPIRKRMKFCPNCGADMREGGQDDRS